MFTVTVAAEAQVWLGAGLAFLGAGVGALAAAIATRERHRY